MNGIERNRRLYERGGRQSTHGPLQRLWMFLRRQLKGMADLADHDDGFGGRRRPGRD